MFSGFRIVPDVKAGRGGVEKRTVTVRRSASWKCDSERKREFATSSSLVRHHETKRLQRRTHLLSTTRHDDRPTLRLVSKSHIHSSLCSRCPQDQLRFQLHRPGIRRQAQAKERMEKRTSAETSRTLLPRVGICWRWERPDGKMHNRRDWTMVASSWCRRRRWEMRRQFQVCGLVMRNEISFGEQGIPYLGVSHRLATSSLDTEHANRMEQAAVLQPGYRWWWPLPDSSVRSRLPKRAP